MKRPEVSALGPPEDVTVSCAVHGPMRYRAAGHWWVCPGWDGEGCCALEAERLTGDMLTVMPAPGSRPSQWGFRAAVPVTPPQRA